MTRQIKFIKGQMYEFELYPLVDSYDKVLKTKPKAFDFNAPEAINQARFHAISLLETMSKKYGVGLAANQVGLDVRLFVMGSQGVGYAFFNPEIVDVSGMTLFEEGCLSFPGLFLPIKRPEHVKIKYVDMNGEEKTQEFDGLSARIILHEYDHMEGVVYTSKVSPLILERQKRKVKKNLKLLAEQQQRIEKQEIIRQAAERLVLQSRKKLSQEEYDALHNAYAQNLESANTVGWGDILDPNFDPAKLQPLLNRSNDQPEVVPENRRAAPLNPTTTLPAPPKQEKPQSDQVVTIEIPNSLISVEK